MSGNFIVLLKFLIVKFNITDYIVQFSQEFNHEKQHDKISDYVNVHLSYNVFFFRFSAAPKAYVDPFASTISAKAGEPFKIKIPYKGSPAPEAIWYNVSAFSDWKVKGILFS